MLLSIQRERHLKQARCIGQKLTAQQRKVSFDLQRGTRDDHRPTRMQKILAMQVKQARC
jgi:hypothetical protein